MNGELTDGGQIYSIDVVILTPLDGHLALVLEKPIFDGGDYALPWDTAEVGETLEGTARRIVQEVTGAAPTWLEQAGAFGDNLDHPGRAAISVAFVAILPMGTQLDMLTDYEWVDINAPRTYTGRHLKIIDASVEMVRDKMDLAPVAFKLLPPNFTLSELQAMYELLLGKRLHKASFRRALQAAWLVEPIDEWRSEGRGRPAQLYKYAPKKKKKGRRGVRFDLL